MPSMLEPTSSHAAMNASLPPSVLLRAFGRLACVAGLGLSACATTQGRAVTAPPDDRVEMEQMVVRADADPLTGLDTYDAETLFVLASEEAKAERFDQAIRIYRKLLGEFPDSKVVPLARYNGALALEALEEHPEAVSLLEALVASEPESADLRRDALFRLARGYGKVENWVGVADTFWAVRQMDNLSPMDELEARVGTGIGFFMQEDYATAERELMRMVTFYQDHEQKDLLPADYFVGQARFYLGEIAARELEHKSLSPPPSEGGGEEAWVEAMAEELEDKCRLLLRAQNNFIRTIRVGHPGWATAAGYRIGTLYEHLFDAMLGVPVPPSLDEGAAEVYREELRERVGILVKKAIRVYEMNRAMAERIGEENEWVERTASALERMKKLYLDATES